MELGLGGKTVLVTGGSRGLGRTIATTFAAEGARVALTYRHNRDAAEAVADGIRGAGSEAVAVQLDLRDPAGVTQAVKTVLDSWGRVDVLVNNAIDFGGLPAGTTGATLLESVPERWIPLYRANTEGPMLLIREVLPPMVGAKWGRIVNVSATVAEDGSRGNLWYAAAKSTLQGVTRTLSVELGPSGILVNNVMPGLVLTPKIQARTNAGWLEEHQAKLPLRRLPTAEEVAGVVVFMGSAANGAITGETIRVSGGRPHG